MRPAPGPHHAGSEVHDGEAHVDYRYRGFHRYEKVERQVVDTNRLNLRAEPDGWRIQSGM